MKRRSILAKTLCAPLAFGWAVGARAGSSDPEAAEPEPTRLAAAWRGPAAGAPPNVGRIDLDWASGRVAIRSETRVPSRAHGLHAEPGGGWLAVAFRPGDWLWRFDAGGRVVGRVSLEDERGERRFTGHVVAIPDAGLVLATEYDAREGTGLIGVRAAPTLRKLDEWPTGGIDPHQLLPDGAGGVVVANGGLPRTADGRKRDLDRMESSLALLDVRRGTIRDLWRLDDRRLGMRHLAWGPAAEGRAPLLGIALQAEHDDALRRARAPVLAVWDGAALAVPSRDAQGEGYAGDIAVAGDGFVLTCQHARVALGWHRGRPAELAVVARMHEPCAVSPVSAYAGGVVVAGALGVGRWHPARSGAMLAWPRPIALDNHWVELG